MKITKALPLVILALTTACTTRPAPKTTTVIIDKPVIKNLDEVGTDLKKLQHSLVRLRVGNPTTESFGTGFFFRSRDLLITTFHLFEAKHPCMESNVCKISLGFAKDSKEVQEQTVAVEVVMRYPGKDLIFLKVQDTTQLTNIIPIKERAKNKKGALTAAGFYQDNPALTFSQGKSLENNGDNNLTSIVVSSGFSGSPIVNTSGELVGVVSSYKPIHGSKVGLAQFMDVEDLSAF